MTEQAKSYDDALPLDPWLRLVETQPPPCDCPCHHWRNTGEHIVACCDNAGLRYVAHGGYYTEHEE